MSGSTFSQSRAIVLTVVWVYLEKSSGQVPKIIMMRERRRRMVVKK